MYILRVLCVKSNLLTYHMVFFHVYEQYCLKKRKNDITYVHGSALCKSTRYTLYPFFWYALTITENCVEGKLLEYLKNIYVRHIHTHRFFFSSI